MTNTEFKFNILLGEGEWMKLCKAEIEVRLALEGSELKEEGLKVCQELSEALNPDNWWMECGSKCPVTPKELGARIRRFYEFCYVNKLRVP